MQDTKLHRDSTDDVFSNFEAPATTDGSYLGNMKYQKAIQEHLSEKFDRELQAVKLRLKAAKTKVGIVISGGTIQLQATLPDKPGGTRIESWQQRISLNIPANLNGLKTAEEEAYELARLIARSQFQWNDKYLRTKSTKLNLTVGDLIDGFEEKYFNTHPRNRRSEHTFSYYLQDVKKLFGSEFKIDYYAIKKCIESIESHPTKQRALKAIKALIKAYDIDIKMDISLGKYQHQKERNIPTDADIERSYQKFEEYSNSRKPTGKKKYLHTWKLWRWVYGILATYGLRPREIFTNPDIDWWLNPENKDNTWKVDKENKTGARNVFPLYPEWVIKFDLKNAEALEMLKDLLKDKQNFSQINAIRVCFSSWMRRVGFEFDPYDLRHAWAIRAHLLGVPVKAAADNLGHTAEVHTEIYQKWFSEDNRKKAINEALERKNDVDLLKDENAMLRLEIIALKLENEKLITLVSGNSISVNNSHMRISEKVS
ncbi:MAG: site-specific integrase [Richelia sp. SM1_7_0]|nr:site-specific integrase [Richelia sp. SM1_7_0]